jgi:phosphohistidine swiveling domain-containing protein
MEHPLSQPKWTLPETGTAARLTRDAVHARVAANLAQLGAPSWTAVGGDRWAELFDAEDGAELAQEIFAAFVAEQGRPYFAGCEVAVREAPDRYVLRSGREPAEADATPADGILGTGDNVFRDEDRTGSVLVVREVATVGRLMADGVPPGTIGVLDDAGGTMTAPILAEFAGIVCLAGSVRSHLAIIAREFGVPTLMGVNLVRPLASGERVTVTYSAAPPGGEDDDPAAARAVIRPAAGGR